jgi:hypothetical protein
MMLGSVSYFRNDIINDIINIIDIIVSLMMLPTVRKPSVLTEIDVGALWAAQKLDKSFRPIPDAEAISYDNADSQISVVDTTPHFANQSRV